MPISMSQLPIKLKELFDAFCYVTDSYEDIPVKKMFNYFIEEIDTRIEIVVEQTSFRENAPEEALLVQGKWRITEANITITPGNEELSASIRTLFEELVR